MDHVFIAYGKCYTIRNQIRLYYTVDSYNYVRNEQK